MVVASGIMVTGTTLFSPLISDLTTVYGVSESQAGLLIVVYTAAAAVAIPVGGVVADRIGRRAVLVPGLVLFGLTGAAVGLVSTFEVALGLRALQAIGYAFAMPIIIAAFGDLYSGARETTVQGVRVAVNNVALTGIPALAGLLFVIWWRFPFAIYLLAIPVAGWLWVALPRIDPPSGSSLTTYVRDITSFINNPPIAMLVSSFLVRFVLMYGVYTYISVLAIREAGLTTVQVGVLLSVAGALGFVTSTQAGRLVTHWEPTLLVLAGFGLLGTGVMLMGVLPIASVLVVGIVLFGIGNGILSPAHKSLVNRVSPTQYRGGVMSIAISVQNVGKVVGSAGVGLVLMFFGPAGAFVLLGLVGGGAGVGLLLGVWWLLE